MIRLGNECAKSLEAIAHVKQEVVPKLKQTGKNHAAGNYKYYDQNDFTNIDDALLKSDCIFLVSTDKDKVNITGEWHEITNAKGDTKDRYVTSASCVMAVRVQYIRNPEDFVEIESYGYKVDLTSDKALGAATIAKRYGYMMMFNIPTTEADPDNDESDFRQQYNGSRKAASTNSKPILDF